VAALAARQHGTVARDQLLALGLSRNAVQYRLRTDRFRRIHPSVYAVGSQPLDQRGRWFAALLATRPDPALSHLSSAAAGGLAAERRAVHVTVARRNARQLDGIALHRVRRLDPADIERIDGLPVTSLPRTLLDLAETERFDVVRKIAEEAERRELLDLDAIESCMRRNRGRRGIAPLARLLEDYVPVGGANDGLETGFAHFAAECGLPPPQRNVLVGGLVVDCWWPEARLVVELDSRKHHAHWSAAERDRERDARLMRLGIQTLRVTDRRLRLARPALLEDIAARFAASGRPLAGHLFR